MAAVVLAEVLLAAAVEELEVGAIVLAEVVLDAAVDKELEGSTRSTRSWREAHGCCE